ncbi:hypothetical protein L218DRAFT_963948 [Marasmius fiardii PR-910]|nr:hypothetical protein L218DRAFT_963948 [Marasmius fiardii PR-910]
MSGNNQTSLDELAIVVTVSEALIMTSFFHWGLFGILTLQIFLYHKAFPKDKLAIRAISYLIYAMEASQTALVSRKVYLLCGQRFGNTDLFLRSRIDGADAAFVAKTGLVGALCQCFSAWRIWVLSRSKPMVTSVVLLSLLSTFATFYGGVDILRLPAHDIKLNLPKDPSTIIWASSSALCDTTIAIFMYMILNRSKTSVQPGTRDVITRLLWLVVTTGTLTAHFVLALMSYFALAFLLGFPSADIYIPIIYLIGKVEANSYFAVLNSRIRLRTQDDANAPHYSDREVVSGRFEVQLGDSVIELDARRPAVQLEVHVQQQVELTTTPPASYHEEDVVREGDTKNVLVLETWPKP